MILTEAHAKTKWCPFVRFHGTPSDDNMSNRDGGVDNGNPGMSRCIGSVCMAWRELHPRESREDHSGASGFMAKRAVDTHRSIRREGGPGCMGHLILDAVGFCGLAGTP